MVIASGEKGARSQPLSNVMRGLLNWHKPKLQDHRDTSTCTGKMEIAVNNRVVLKMPSFSQNKYWCHWLFLIFSYMLAQSLSSWPASLCRLLLCRQSLAAIFQSVKGKTRLISSRWLPWRGKQQNNPSLLLSFGLHLRYLLNQQTRYL